MIILHLRFSILLLLSNIAFQSSSKKCWKKEVVDKSRVKLLTACRTQTMHISHQSDILYKNTPLKLDKEHL